MNKKTGIIEIKKESATITFERHFPHPIERVWKTITNPEQRAAWFGPTTIEPKEGGTIETIAQGPPASENVQPIYTK